MSSTKVSSDDATNNAGVGKVNMKLEVVAIPVSNVDRSKEFYAGLGWRLDADFDFGAGYRVVQFTPPGSGCSVAFGDGVTTAEPGSAHHLELVVSDIVAAREDLATLGANPSEVFHGSPFNPAARIDGPDPQRTSYRSYAIFEDPDGNSWTVQEVTTRLPGRIDSDVTSFSSVNDLASAMRRASTAHGEHEKRHGGEYDENWPDWYAAYMVAEQTGAELPE
jgi:catechol 2,3-dioxygenase-like lactoylglutathione lyase family enzyme